jgi:hypothetical protein
MHCCASTLQAFMMILQIFFNTIDILHNKIRSSKKKSVGGFIHDSICIFMAKTHAFCAKQCMSQCLKSTIDRSVQPPLDS